MLKTFDSINSITQVKQSSGNLKKGKNLQSHHKRRE
jgi:hypothetical protein